MSEKDEMLEELKKIRELLTPAPEPPPEKPKNLLYEFKDFLSKYKIMGLAVAFIMGLYVGALVKSLVDNIIMPIIGYIIPGINWEDLILGNIRIGLFLSDIITFVIVALVIFLIVKLTSKLGID